MSREASEFAVRDSCHAKRLNSRSEIRVIRIKVVTDSCHAKRLTLHKRDSVQHVAEHYSGIKIAKMAPIIIRLAALTRKALRVSLVARINKGAKVLAIRAKGSVMTGLLSMPSALSSSEAMGIQTRAAMKAGIMMPISHMASGLMRPLRSRRDFSCDQSGHQKENRGSCEKDGQQC